MTKKVLIELYKNKISENIRTHGTISMRFEGAFVNLLGFSFNHKISNSFHACFIGITSDNGVFKDIYFNSIKEELTVEEHSDLLNVWKSAICNYDFKLLEDLVSKSELNISRRVLTEKRTSKEKFKI